ncbi:unnamed protein product [Nesidiocoris tenuis]|uniref:Uncharacterized protein n=1 Tax=Nesidiocoris tenuis TaxID=355587 RepID=A0A6H5GHA5_9HEMI|nr:unnamed protein product [Nesidiocoris tenuis]
MIRQKKKLARGKKYTPAVSLFPGHLGVKPDSQGFSIADREDHFGRSFGTIIWEEIRFAADGGRCIYIDITRIRAALLNETAHSGAIYVQKINHPIRLECSISRRRSSNIIISPCNIISFYRKLREDVIIGELIHMKKHGNYIKIEKNTIFEGLYCHQRIYFDMMLSSRSKRAEVRRDTMCKTNPWQLFPEMVEKKTRAAEFSHGISETKVSGHKSSGEIRLDKSGPRPEIYYSLIHPFKNKTEWTESIYLFKQRQRPPCGTEFLQIFQPKFDDIIPPKLKPLMPKIPSRWAGDVNIYSTGHSCARRIRAIHQETKFEAKPQASGYLIVKFT